MLPFAADGPSAIAPPAPLILAQAAGLGALRPGLGARLDKRLLVYSLLAMPLSQRRPGGRYEWRHTVREVGRLLWPDTWRPSKHGRALLLGLNAMYFARGPHAGRLALGAGRDAPAARSGAAGLGGRDPAGAA